jgi:hypothetical protein
MMCDVWKSCVRRRRDARRTGMTDEVLFQEHQGYSLRIEKGNEIVLPHLKSRWKYRRGGPRQSRYNAGQIDDQTQRPKDNCIMAHGGLSSKEASSLNLKDAENSVSVIADQVSQRESKSLVKVCMGVNF